MAPLTKTSTILESSIESSVDSQIADNSSHGKKLRESTKENNITSVKVSKRNLGKYTSEEVLKHNTKESCWIIIDNLVYDVTHWVPKHPGGDLIYTFGGHDVTDLFLAFHTPQIEKMKITYLIGELIDKIEPNNVQKDCRKLREKIIKEGLLETDVKFYLLDNLYCLFLFLVVLSCQYFGVYWGNSAWIGGENVAIWFRIIAGGATMGFFWQEIAALLHDSLHSAICHNMKLDDLLGWLYSCVCFGISGQWWKNNHNRHHAYPNALNPDGTIADQQQDVRPFFVQYPSVKPYVTTFYEKFFIKLQHITFIPIVWFIGRYAIVIDSIVHLVEKDRAFEIFGLFLHWAWVLIGIWHAGPAWYHKFIAYAVAGIVEGVLHLQLEMNHFSKPMIPLEKVKNEIDFFTYQIITSRNVRLVIPFEWRLHGGLHKQIEHHMFPLVPRHNLHKLSPIVKEICCRNGIDYDEVHTFPGAIWTVLKNLYNIGYQEFPEVVH